MVVSKSALMEMKFGQKLKIRKSQRLKTGIQLILNGQNKKILI